MGKTIVLVHGAWVTPLCWENFVGYFSGRGYTCLTPAWPYRDRPIDELRRRPAPELGQLGLVEIVDHYDKFICGLGVPPILIGHSYGGLFVQMLLDRGLIHGDCLTVTGKTVKENLRDAGKTRVISAACACTRRSIVTDRGYFFESSSFTCSTVMENST